MKQFLYTMLLLFMSELTPVAKAQSYVWQSLTPNDVVGTVQSFEQNSNLNVVVTNAAQANSTQPDPTFDYELTAGHYDYSIPQTTKDEFFRDDHDFSLEQWDNFYGKPYDPNSLSTQAMSQTAAQAIATAFMLTHYPEPALLNNPVSVESDIDDNVNEGVSSFIRAYEFTFSQTCGNGAYGPCECIVKVDTIKGQVVHYFSSHFPVLISTTASLTGDQAMAAAMNALQVTQGVPDAVQDLGVSKPDAFGFEQLTYDVTFFGTLPNGNDESFSVNVDANTGIVSEWDISQSDKPVRRVSTRMKHTDFRLSKVSSLQRKMLKFSWNDRLTSLSYAPLLIHGHPLMYSGYLCSGSPGAKITIDKGKDKQVTINGQNRLARLHLNNQFYQVKGQSKRMSAKPALINGRCYVPLDVMNTVLPGKFTYNAKTQTVRYDPPQPKQASK